MKFLVCLVFFVSADFTSGQSTVQGMHSCSAQGPPGLPGRDGRDGRDCPCGTKDTQISELQSKYQELRDQTSGLRQQNEDLEQRLSVLEDRIGNKTQSDSAGYPPSSCTEVAERSGIHDQAFYMIDPDGPGRGVLPMVVQCDLQGETPITLISHDSEARTHVKGFKGAGSYSKDVTYWNSMEQVRAVVDQSSSCKQHIKYECYGSVIWDGSTPYAWWVTWDGRQADYWGGASPGSGKCACGQTGACSGSCYCDANENTWREDSGFLSHKNDLPVTQLRFGDTDDAPSEAGFYALGKLICYP
ncbi:PREDICTED: contactin-associated protein-like 2 [Branchiostoma belcheri]|uniref:Contactin-associated protein-like 2 n=1 Tax=Branchiostoma belcheri TaxID=7741 RepID=A0A6P5A3V6_BRABE|nr:PREDICTED: contactin-associated protein-like 2 [Branchiostoma belcheri]